MQETTTNKSSKDAPQNLATSLQENRLGLDLGERIFSWDLPENIPQQKAYQILVASTAQKLAANVGDLWDSGKRYSSDHTNVAYAGKSNSAGNKGWWKVRVWDQNDNIVPYSKGSSFEHADASNLHNRIVLLGGTLISRMEKHAFLETAISAYYPHQNISFRNLGWPGDDVDGTARSEFGSAHNTKSWQPPKSEKGFGYGILRKQIKEANPKTVILGYGAEVAFAESEEVFETFTRGYVNLLNAIDSTGAKLILLSPTRHENFKGTQAELANRNKRLKRATDFIESQATTRNYRFIDLFGKESTSGLELKTENGIHLTENAYQKMSEMILSKLGIAQVKGFSLAMTESVKILASRGLSMNDFVETETGIRFDVKPDRISPQAELQLEREHLVKVDGALMRERALDTKLEVGADKKQWEELRQAIIEKNRLHRLRINPLNKAYIFLFRRHEMGHLSREMDDFDRLVEEKEELIARLKIPKERRYEIEILEPWKSPQEYKEYYVPKEVPMPNVAEELASFTVPEGFEIELFAKDPMIVNPINLNWDTKGRAWVASSSTYPQVYPGREPNDRIVILEDTDQDGVVDKHTIFAEGLIVPHSVMPVKGGAYLCNTTEVWFYADNDGDDVADEKRLVFSGFGTADMHHTIHGFRWAPWGDLYFTQSIYINSFIETACGPRRLNGSGIWEFRPETERLEVFSTGMVNPWGHAFDKWGQSYATDGAGGSGPHYVYQGSAHPTAVGAARVMPGLIPGKPKNTGAEIISSSHIPADWQGTLIANDYRANRTVRYKLTETGSGYAAEELETLIHSKHRSYRPIDLKIGPDGAIYVVDWYNPIIAHGEVDFHHPMRDKSHGRIWRLTKKGSDLVDIPKISGASASELLELLKSPEQYTRLQANRELVQQGVSPDKVMFWILGLDRKDPRYEQYLLEGLWLNGALSHPSKKLISTLLDAKDHHIRAAATRMIAHWKDDFDGMDLLSKSIKDEHPQVRLEAVNALREIKSLAAVELAMQALDLPMDENLDFALWSTAREGEVYWLPELEAGKKIFEGKSERLGYAMTASGNKEALTSLLPLIEEGRIAGEERENILIMLASVGGKEELDAVFEVALKEKNLNILEALAGASMDSIAVPGKAASIIELMESDSEDLRIVSAQLIGRWNLKQHKNKLAQRAANKQISTHERFANAMSLIEVGEIEPVKLLANTHESLGVKASSAAAWAKKFPEEAAAANVAVLSKKESADYAELLFSSYLNREDGPDILTSALAGKKLSAAIAQKGIALIQASGKEIPDLTKALKTSLPKVVKKEVLTKSSRERFLEGVASKGNAARGGKIYQRANLLCSTCHMLNGKGGKLGPDLSPLGSYSTASGILESLVNPSDNIKQGYETVIITRKDGTTVSGTLQRKTDTGAIVMDGKNKLITVPNTDIAKLYVSPVSMMPPGLTNSLSEEELRDLIKYLTELGK